MFQDVNSYPTLAVLEARWQAIRDEYDQVAEPLLSAWSLQNVADEDSGWRVFGLMQSQYRLADNWRCCPVTTAALAELKGVTSAGFSVLEPGAHLPPHRGLPKGVLRVHLGVTVPDGSTIRVRDVTRSWDEGRVLVFDDTNEHEVHNHSDRRRVVLLLDILPDPAADKWVHKFIRALERWQTALHVRFGWRLPAFVGQIAQHVVRGLDWALGRRVT